ncbi:HalOD1 output domain-containing protein [Natrarchaeobius oligotrophus]|uniref:Halobacterial output domain-containing protein n=1 Tax=Natrarchaeobius chitinivorans TaxID=1679083 RepID=A0A3N6MDL8_NATCH|nr:HalOD1 output domain-containing protein [Natrarchaeobius chitinivorans]RQH00868.1 hypothetical protein EA472_09585 [Natrarchaeobius chitinivorans]
MNFQNKHKIVADGGSTTVIEEQPSESTAQAVIRGVSAVQGTPKCDLDPLYNSIEPEALNELTRHSQRTTGETSVEFTYEGFTVEVQDEGSVQITDSPPD